ncbi:DUF296 domain-containing protein [bacterium]|nr:DUF296 domain-containing protein [bacterium]
MKIIAFRLKPGQDLLEEINSQISSEVIQAAAIFTIVGSLTQATLRLAGANESKLFEGPFEIVSAEGTMGPDGSHIHISISSAEGETFGGHLQMGSLVNTTAEIVLADLSEHWRFKRKICELSGYPELHPIEF